MKDSYNYFPFIVLSLICYGLFFYFTNEAQKTTQLIPSEITLLPMDPDKVSHQAHLITDNPSTKESAEKINSSEIQQISSNIVEKNITVRSQEASNIATPAIGLSNNIQQTQQTKVEFELSIKDYKTTNTASLKEFIFQEDLVHLPKLIKKQVAKQKTAKQKRKTSKQVDERADNALISIASELPIVTPTNIVENTIQPKITIKPKLKTTYNNNSAASVKLQPKTVLVEKLSNTFPQAIAISGKTPIYPKRSALRQQKGQVTIDMTVLRSGVSTGAKIVHSSGYKLLDRSVLNFVGNELFKPSIQAGQPITTKQSYSFHFE